LRNRNRQVVTLEQKKIGGTVASYPRRKLIMTEALELPLGERLEAAIANKKLHVMHSSVPVSIDEHAVQIRHKTNGSSSDV
jgi:hypothetical protein